MIDMKLETLPRAARIAAEARFGFSVRPSAGLQFVEPGGAPLRGGKVGADELGYVLAAPRYPAVHVPAPVADSILADALARYGVMIGVARPPLRRS